MRCLLAVAAALLAFSAVDGDARAEVLKARLAQNLSPISGVAIVAKQKGFFDKQSSTSR
jgi:NitT/TauT family transport system substrate-binding protein